MAKVSILIPARNEKYLTKTVEEIFAKATGEIEVVVVVDGPTKYPLPSPRSNFKLIKKSTPKGLRAAINTGAAAATGKYLLKLDAHCALPWGFDLTLQQDCEENWVVVPRTYVLDVDRWDRDLKSRPIDYAYFSCPWNNAKYPDWFMLVDCRWYVRDETRKEILVDDLMTFIGCCWFMPTTFFQSKLGGLNTTDFGDFAENQEISLKTWLGGGRMVLNKKIWCAHWEQKNPERGYEMPKSVIFRSQVAVAKYFVNNQWPGQVHNFAWLIEKFWPLPSSKDESPNEINFWPEDWKTYYTDQINQDAAELAELAMKYGSDKCPQIHHFYTGYYAAIFNGKKQNVKKVLEIGVGWPGCMPHVPNYQTGASLYMWRDFFPNAQIYGADISPDLVFIDHRIQTFLCSQTDPAALADLIHKIGSDIDLVIDDGSHVPEDQVFTCLTLMPMLQTRVIYIIEDVRHKEIVRYLKGYQTEIIRKARMSGPDDRLIKAVKKAKNG